MIHVTFFTHNDPDTIMPSITTAILSRRIRHQNGTKYTEAVYKGSRQVCLYSWIEYLFKEVKNKESRNYDELFPKEKTGQEFNRNGVFTLYNKLSYDDIVVIHDGIRLLVDEGVLIATLSIVKLQCFFFLFMEIKHWKQ